MSNISVLRISYGVPRPFEIINIDNIISEVVLKKINTIEDLMLKLYKLEKDRSIFIVKHYHIINNENKKIRLKIFGKNRGFIRYLNKYFNTDLFGNIYVTAEIIREDDVAIPCSLTVDIWNNVRNDIIF